MSQIISLLLRVPETDCNQERFASQENGGLSFDFYNRYWNANEIRLSGLGHFQARERRPYVHAALAEAVKDYKLSSSRFLLVHSDTERARDTINDVFGNAHEFQIEHMSEPDGEALRPREYGVLHGLSPKDRLSIKAWRARPGLMEFMQEVQRVGEFDAVPQDGESKRAVANRHCVMVKKAEAEAQARDISLVVYIADTGSGFYDLMAKLLGRPPEDAGNLTKEIPTGVGAVMAIKPPLNGATDRPVHEVYHWGEVPKSTWQQKLAADQLRAENTRPATSTAAEPA